MKRYIAVCISICFSIIAAAVTATRASGDVVTEVTKANDEVQVATLKHDTKTMDRAITKDFILVLSGGQMVNRAEWLDGVRDPSVAWEENKTESLAIHHYNNDCALAIGVLHLRYRQEKKLVDVRLRFTDLWVKQNGGWKWASSQVAHFKASSKK